MLLIEIVVGIALGALVVRALPRVVDTRLLIGFCLVGVLGVLLMGGLVYPVWESGLVAIAVMVSWGVGGAALRTEEVRSRFGGEELMLLGLALSAVVVSGALLGYSLLAVVAGFGSATILVLAFVAAGMLAGAFGMILMFMQRGRERPVDWNDTIHAASVLDAGGVDRRDRR